MSVGNVTITADIGPGNSVTSLVLNDVRDLRFNFNQNRLQVILQNGKTRDFDFSTISTITHSISSAVDTITIST